MVRWKTHEVLLINKSPTFPGLVFSLVRETIKIILHKIISYAPIGISSDQVILGNSEPWELLPWKLAMRLILGTQYHSSGFSKDKPK